MIDSDLDCIRRQFVNCQMTVFRQTMIDLQVFQARPLQLRRLDENRLFEIMALEIYIKMVSEIVLMRSAIRFDIVVQM